MKILHTEKKLEESNNNQMKINHKKTIRTIKEMKRDQKKENQKYDGIRYHFQ